MDVEACESCGRDGERLVGVHRVYVAASPAAVERDPTNRAEDRIVDEVEQWCLACVTTFPNRLAD